jgi:hypothetical protein
MATVTLDSEGFPVCSCGALLVDDGHGPLYDAATDDGTPHVCPPS